MTIVESIEALNPIAVKFLARLPVYSDHATVVGLSGELGAGKTAFTKALAHALGVSDVITSPTFVIQKNYSTQPSSRFTSLVHIDAYRLNRKDELLPLRFSETLSTPGALVVVEWPEQVPGALPKDAILLTFSPINEHTRSINGLSI